MRLSILMPVAGPFLTLPLLTPTAKNLQLLFSGKAGNRAQVCFS